MPWVSPSEISKDTLIQFRDLCKRLICELEQKIDNTTDSDYRSKLIQSLEIQKEGLKEYERLIIEKDT